MANYSSAVQNYAGSLNAVTFPQVDRDKIVDQVFNTSPLFALLRSAGNLREVEGGLFIQRTINVAKSPNATWYRNSGGWKMSSFEGLIALGWDWKLAHDGVVIIGDEIIKNENSDDAIVDLIQGKIDVTSLTLPDLIGSDMFRNNPYGTNSDGTPGNPDSIEGLAVQVDDGTISNIVGQQSRTAYPVLSSPCNYGLISTTSGQVAPTLIPALQAQWTRANQGGLTRTKVNFTTAAIYNAFWASLQAPERYVIDPRRLEAIGIKTTGGNDLAFNDAVVLLDPKVPTGVPSPTAGLVYGPGAATGGFWYGLNTDFFELVVHPSRFFSIGEWYKDPYGDQYFLDIYFAGALTGQRPNRQFALWAQAG